MKPQTLWPFTYPYGQLHSFNDTTIRLLRDLGFDCAYTTVPGPNYITDNRFLLRRVDTVDVRTKLPAATRAVTASV